MFSVPVRNQTDNRSTDSNEPSIRTLTLTSQNWKRVEHSLGCYALQHWSEAGVMEGSLRTFTSRRTDPPGTQWVGQSQCPMNGWDRLQVDAGWLQSAGRQVSCWANFHLWWAFLPAPCFGISAWRFQQLQVESGKGATVCGIFNKNFITQP